jgi:hypothetical protein
VAQNIGPSRFSHNERDDDMLEITSPRPDVAAPIEHCLDQNQKLELLRVYHLAVSMRYSDILELPSRSDEAIIS